MEFPYLQPPILLERQRTDSTTPVTFYFRHIAENYIAKEGAEGLEKKTAAAKRNIVRCRLGTSQDQGKFTPPHVTWYMLYNSCNMWI